MSWLELKIPPVVVAMLFMALGGWLGMHDTWLHDRSLDLTIPGCFLVTLGVIVIIAGIAQFRRHQTTVDPTHPGKASALVQSGIFAYTRNPMYLGMSILVASAAVFTASLLALAAVPLFMLYLTRFQILPEESAVLALFGQEYKTYKKRVRRWI